MRRNMRRMVGPVFEGPRRRPERQRAWFHANPRHVQSRVYSEGRLSLDEKPATEYNESHIVEDVSGQLCFDDLSYEETRMIEKQCTLSYFLGCPVEHL